MTIHELQVLLKEDSSKEAVSLLKSLDNTSKKIIQLNDAKVFFSSNSIQVYLLNKMIANELEKLEVKEPVEDTEVDATAKSESGEQLNSDVSGSSESGLDLDNLDL